MDKIRIQGGRRLSGRIPISGAKNAALPLMCASLLTEETLTLVNLPHLADISTLATLLSQHGVEIGMDGSANGGHTGKVLKLTAGEISNTTAPYDIVRKMRASVLVLGPLVARMGHARVSLPGGCSIGARPVDLHLKGLQALGAEIDLQQGYIEARAPNGLKGGRFVFPSVSVGATENLVMAAALADGETTLVNAAREPEIVDLCRCLKAMGADIEGHGSDTIRIVGQKRLVGTVYPVVADRIEAGTYAIAAAITGGEVELVGIKLGMIEALVKHMAEAGIAMTASPDGVRVSASNGVIGTDVITEPYPGFPTDLQAQFMTLMTIADGASMVTETIFENRFMHVPELSRMGANITVHQSSALVRGVKKLTGAPVMATDLRASVSLVLAGLAAEGTTEVNRIYHLDRGYERIEEKLGACGAAIERVRPAAPPTTEALAVTNKSLKLRAEDAEDLAIISAALQDAAVPVADMRYFPEDKRFMLAASRYRWEADRGANAGGGERIASALIFDHVTRVRRRGIEQADGERILSLLALKAAPGAVDLQFSGDATIRLEIEKISCRLDDFGEAWPTIFRPEHKD